MQDDDDADDDGDNRAAGWEKTFRTIRGTDEFVAATEVIIAYFFCLKWLWLWAVVGHGTAGGRSRVPSLTSGTTYVRYRREDSVEMVPLSRAGSIRGIVPTSDHDVRRGNEQINHRHAPRIVVHGIRTKY